MIEYAYHCTSNGDIKEFIPHVSSHGKAYVYATPNKSLALVFGVPEHGDYVVHPLYDSISNTCTFVEMQPDALAKYYRGKSAYLYTVNKDNFTETTGWKGEICSSNPVKPIKVEYIEDLEQAILNEQKSGRLELIQFDERNNHGRNMDDFFAKRDLGYLIKRNDEQQAKRFVGNMKNTGNKELFLLFKKHLSTCLESFSSKETKSIPDNERIVPKEILERYKTDTSDEIICDIFYNFNYLSLDNIEQATAEIKETNNRVLMQKIVFRLTKLNNIVKEIDAKAPIVQSKTME